MKKVILILICLVLFIIDNSFMPFIAVNNIYPSILFCFIISFSIINGGFDALLVGVVGGLLQDIYFPYAFGVNALVNVILCYLSALWGERLFRNKRFVPVVISGVMSVLKYLFIFIIMYLIKKSMSIDMNVIIMAIYNMVVTFLIYRSVYRFANKDEIKKQWDFADK